MGIATSTIYRHTLMEPINYLILTSREISTHLDDLVAFLRATIARGEARGFGGRFGQVKAARYWHQVQRAVRRGLAALLIARTQGNTIVGCVQLHVDKRTLAPHQANIEQLIVHGNYRQRGIAQQLMCHVETHAHRLGYTALAIAAHRDDPATHLYQSLGYDPASPNPSSAPKPAPKPSAGPDTSVSFYKLLRTQAA